MQKKNSLVAFTRIYKVYSGLLISYYSKINYCNVLPSTYVTSSYQNEQSVRETPYVINILKKTTRYCRVIVTYPIITSNYIVITRITQPFTSLQFNNNEI